MKRSLFTCLFLSLIGSQVWAAGGNMFGFNLGFGLPYVQQAGLNYVHSSNRFSMELGYNNFSLDVGSVGVGLTKPELSLRWHPFAGSFYLGLGLGQMTMYAKSTQLISTEIVESKIEVSATTMTGQLGWMWGMSDGGFFGGMEFGFQSPSSPTSTATTSASASVTGTAEYQQMISDIDEQAKKYGETGFATMTLLRIGYLF